MANPKAVHLKQNSRWRARLSSAKSKEPPVIANLRRVESLMSGLPWKWVGAFLFAIGCLPLFGYLLVIDYVPPNLLGIVGLASIASIWLLLLWAIITAVMFGVTAVAFVYGVKHLDLRTTVLGQVGPLCAVLCWLLWSYGLWFSVPLVACTVGAMAWTLIRLLCENPRRNGGEVFLAVAALLLGGALVSLAVLLVVTHSSSVLAYRGTPVSLWTGASWLAAIVVLICANAVATNVRAAPLAVWGVCFVSSGLMVLALGGPSYVASVVATKVGLRLPGTVGVLVPMSTCVSVVAATERGVKHSEAGPVPPCASASNALMVDVDLRWGDRWLVAVKSINGMRLPEPSVRLTIPDKDTELVFR